MRLIFHQNFSLTQKFKVQNLNATFCTVSYHQTSHHIIRTKMSSNKHSRKTHHPNNSRQSSSLNHTSLLNLLHNALDLPATPSENFPASDWSRGDQSGDFHAHYRSAIFDYINDKSNVRFKRILDRAVTKFFFPTDPIYFLTHQLMMMTICDDVERSEVPSDDSVCVTNTSVTSVTTVEKEREGSEGGSGGVDNFSLHSVPSGRWTRWLV